VVPHLPAAILILLDRPHPDKQEALALAAATAEELHVAALCHQWEDCLALVVTRYILVVVSACDPGSPARRALESAGARLVVAREEQPRIRRDVAHLAVRMYRRGIDTQEISAILEVCSRDIRAALSRAGIRRRQ
jgi:hypothetical protein